MEQRLRCYGTRDSEVKSKFILSSCICPVAQLLGNRLGTSMAFCINSMSPDAVLALHSPLPTVQVVRAAWSAHSMCDLNAWFLIVHGRSIGLEFLDLLAFLSSAS